VLSKYFWLNKKIGVYLLCFDLTWSLQYEKVRFRLLAVRMKETA